MAHPPAPLPPAGSRPVLVAKAGWADWAHPRSGNGRFVVSRRQPPPKKDPHRIAKVLNPHVLDHTPEIDAFMRDIEKLPLPLAQKLAALGLQVYAGARPIWQLDPSLAYLQNYVDQASGRTEDQIAGEYLAAQKAVAIGYTKQPFTSASIVLHELGHAMGDLLGWDSDPALAAFHAQVYPKLSPFFQGPDGPGGVRGRQEMLAEGTALILSGQGLLAARRFGGQFAAWLYGKLYRTQ